MENTVSECIPGFRKTHGTQHSLILMLEKWRFLMFMDIAKTFDAINHDFLQTKLRAHDLSKLVLSLICSYLNNGETKSTDQ